MLTSGGLIFGSMIVLSFFYNANYLIGFLLLLFMLIGLIDDIVIVSIKIRSILYSIFILIFILEYGLNQILVLNNFIIENKFVISIIFFLILFSTINIINFMDGVDGLCAAQLIFMYLIIFLYESFYFNNSIEYDYKIILSSLTAFLIFNWQPSKIFMGNTGSIFLGALTGFAFVIYNELNTKYLWIWLMLFGLFFIDTFLTLIIRITKTQKILSPHKEHLYQRLAIKYNSHYKIVLYYMLVNILFIAPYTYLYLNYFSAYGFNATLLLYFLLVALYYFVNKLNFEKMNS